MLKNTGKKNKTRRKNTWHCTTRKSSSYIATDPTNLSIRTTKGRSLLEIKWSDTRSSTALQRKEHQLDPER